MTTQREFLERLLDLLKESGIQSMLSGSVASSFHGEPRATNDIDLVIVASRSQLERFLAAVLELGWYANEDAALTALDDRTMFNVIDPIAGWKADLIIRKDRAFSVCEFERRISAHVLGADASIMSVTTPEDTILSKLEWARGAHSDRQYHDALRVAALRATELDRAYLELWAGELGLTEDLQRLLADADARQE